MALKDLLVHVDCVGHGVERIRLAADLAARHGARMTIMHAREPSIAQRRRLRAAELGLMPATAVTELQHAIEECADTDMRALQDVFAGFHPGAEIEIEWLDVVGPAVNHAVQYARTADLTVIGHDLNEYDDLPEGFSFAEALLFGTGRPVIVVPASCSEDAIGRTVAVAWNGSRPAARALSDALPIIERAEQVILLMALPDRAETAGSAAMDRALANLQRHNANAESVIIEVDGRSVGDALQDHALRLGADLLVAGAYGHPRLWEKFLGGVTYDLLARMRMPVLMAH